MTTDFVNVKALGARICRAHAAIHDFIRETPVEFSRELASPPGTVYLKLESEQCTGMRCNGYKITKTNDKTYLCLLLSGSFKVRGAVNKLMCELTRISNVKVRMVKSALDRG